MLHIPDVVIGIERADHKHFDDIQETQKLAHPVKISVIKIQYNKEHVTGVKLKYKGVDGKQVKGTCSMKFKVLGGIMSGTKKEKFTIDDDDCIKEIHGFVGTEINQFGFITYKGVSHKCGVSKGVAFSHHFPLHTFTSARGSYDKYLEFIAFRVAPLSPDQIKKFGLTQQQGNVTIVTTNTVQPPPPAQQYHPPGQQYPPPGQQYPPPGQQYPPPGQQYPPPGQQYPPPGQQYPPGQYPPPGQQYPPPGQQYPPPGQQYPPPGQQYPPPGQQYPPPGQQYPPQAQYPPQPQQNTTVIIEQQAPPPAQKSGVSGGVVAGALVGGAIVGAALANNHHHHQGPEVVVVKKHH